MQNRLLDFAGTQAEGTKAHKKKKVIPKGFRNFAF